MNLIPSILITFAQPSGMATFTTIVGLIIIVLVLLDAFETVVLPRRVSRHFRLTAWFFRHIWKPWVALAGLIPSPTRRESFLGYFGPVFSILLLVAWAVSLIFAFTLLQYGTGQHVRLGSETVTFGMLLYHSGETFFTLGYGDIVPVTPIARMLAVSEAGMGFAFLGVVIGYLPVIYSSFNTRELEISLLDSRAGSPPSATELISRLGCCPDPAVLDGIFRDWERWSANLLSHQISYPVLSYFRSQHSNQSWLGALTVMLDVTSLVIGGIEGIHTDQAKLTFAMARHAAVDLAQVINAKYNAHAPDRLSGEDLEGMRKALAAAGVRLRPDEASANKLAHLRSLYEPYVEAMSRNLQITLPPWIHREKHKDNWQGGPWDRAIQAKGLGEKVHVADEHF